MEQINEQKAVYLISIGKLISEIYAKSKQLIFNSNSVAQKHELSMMVHELRDGWLAANIDRSDITADTFFELEGIFSTQRSWTKQFLDVAKSFYDAVTGIVFLELNKWINSYIYIYISRSLAEKLFEFCASAPRINSEAVFLVNLIQNLRFASENEKFEFLMGIVMKYPDLLSGESMPHPDYVYKSSDQRTFDKCPICGGDGEPYHCSFSYRMVHFNHPFWPFKLWMKCNTCQNLYTKKFPEKFLELSTHNKLITPGENSQTAVSDITSAHALAVWSSIINKLRAYTDKKLLLEVGIGNGELLSVALEMNYQVDAVEIVEESAQRVSDILGISIHNCDFLNFSTNKTYPIIIMGDVIEHVTDPEAALRNVYCLLDDDGVLWLSTPNYESSFTRLKKFTDAMWHEPYHITYFNYNGLEALLDKCGFTVREYVVSNRYNGSMELIITKK